MPDITEIPEIEDPAEKQAMEQNIRAHKLAYKIQRAFFQARIEGLGKPFEVLLNCPPIKQGFVFLNHRQFVCCTSNHVGPRAAGIC